MLWKDKKSMDEFFRLDPANEEFYEVYNQLRDEPFAMMADGVKVFNEVYYQVTRMMFERPMPSDLPKYISDIKANLGWKYSAELVMSMTYFMTALIGKDSRQLNKFFTKSINEAFGGCIYWKPFKHCFEAMRKRGMHIRYMFRPHPCSVEDLSNYYIRWDTVTNCYNLSSIEHVMSLWSDKKSRQEIAEWIIASMNNTQNNNAVKVDYEEVRWYLNNYLDKAEDSPVFMCAEPDPFSENISLNERIAKLEKENKALKGRIDELETENKRLNALAEKKTNGSSRKFALVEIVEYCKNRVEWDDVKSIVAMLNKLLLRKATKDDEILVDSIETEFASRRYGITNVANQNVFPNVGNYNAHVDEQHYTVPFPSIGQKEFALIENEYGR